MRKRVDPKKGRREKFSPAFFGPLSNQRIFVRSTRDWAHIFLLPRTILINLKIIFIFSSMGSEIDEVT